VHAIGSYRSSSYRGKQSQYFLSTALVNKEHETGYNISLADMFNTIVCVRNKTDNLNRIIIYFIDSSKINMLFCSVIVLSIDLPYQCFCLSQSRRRLELYQKIKNRRKTAAKCPSCAVP